MREHTATICLGIPAHCCCCPALRQCKFLCPAAKDGYLLDRNPWHWCCSLTSENEIEFKWICFVHNI